jgi:hypothetical protein
LNGVVVSGNHKVMCDTQWIRVEDHPESEPADSIPFLMCLNTSTHCIPIGNNLFKDFEETSDISILKEFTALVEQYYNGFVYNVHRFNHVDFYNKERGFAAGTLVRMNNGIIPIEEVRIGDTMSRGGKVIGVFQHGLTYRPVDWAQGLTMGLGTWILNQDFLTYAGETATIVPEHSTVYHLMTEHATFEVMDSFGNVFTVLDDQELSDPDVHKSRDTAVQSS